MVLVFRGPVFPAAFETPGPWSHPVSAWFEARRWNENHFWVWIGAWWVRFILLLTYGEAWGS